jgi:hypothetical protein
MKNLGARNRCSRQVEDGGSKKNLVVFETWQRKHCQPQAEKNERKNYIRPPT